MLYKFHSFNDNNISAFEKNSAWFSKPASFNDPFEGIYSRKSCNLTDDESIKIFRDMYKNEDFKKYIILNESADEFLTKVYIKNQGYILSERISRFAIHQLDNQQKYFHQSGISCFIKDGNGILPYEDQLMWGHYGNGLKGYALVFDDEYSLFEDDNLIVTDVIYKEHPPEIDPIHLLKTYARGTDTDSAVIEQLRLMSTKNIKWKYECERRFINYRNGDGLKSFKKGAISALIIGSKMPTWQKTALIEIAKSNKIFNIQEATTRTDSYKVELRSLY
ncbi:hypothetical protein D3C72_271160 [compost metagenome]